MEAVFLAIWFMAGQHGMKELILRVAPVFLNTFVVSCFLSR